MPKVIERENLKRRVAEIIKNYHDENGFQKIITSQTIREILQEKGVKSPDCSISVINEIKKDAIDKLLYFDVKLRRPVNTVYKGHIESRFKSKGLKEAIVIDLYPDESIIEALGKKSAEFFEKTIKDEVYFIITAQCLDYLKNIGNTSNLIKMLHPFKDQRYNEKEFLEKIETIDKEYKSILYEHAKENKKVVLSCGQTILEMVKQIDKNKNYQNLEIISSIVLCIDSFQKTSPSVLINEFTNKFNSVKGFAYQLPEKMLERLSDDKKNINLSEGRQKIYEILKESIFRKALKADYFFLGIGSLSDDRAKFSAGFNSLVQSSGCYKSLKKICDGEISHWPVLKYKKQENQYWVKNYIKNNYENINDIENINEFFNKIYTIDFNELIKRKESHQKVVAVAGGKEKVKAIRDCLEIEGLVDILITDTETAKGINDSYIFE